MYFDFCGRLVCGCLNYWLLFGCLLDTLVACLGIIVIIVGLVVVGAAWLLISVVVSPVVLSWRYVVVGWLTDLVLLNSVDYAILLLVVYGGLLPVELVV